MLAHTSKTLGFCKKIYRQKLLTSIEARLTTPLTMQVPVKTTCNRKQSLSVEILCNAATMPLQSV